jgi:hypothetical protein
VKAGKGELIHGWVYGVGRGRVSAQLIFCHPQTTDMRHRFKQTKNWGQGGKPCNLKWFQSQVVYLVLTQK